MNFMVGRKTRVGYYSHQSGKTIPADVRAAFEAVGARMVSPLEERPEILLFGVCSCCKNSIATLGKMIGEGSSNARADGGMGVVLFSQYKEEAGLDIFGLLNGPTPDELVAAAWSLHPQPRE
ncbi:MAG: hypothetical protein JWN64_576 [Parcubacteria group bacterium]|nr:hypothetical protein [Parcubacteria group bacterium]